MALNELSHSKTTVLCHPTYLPGAVRIPWCMCTHAVVFVQTRAVKSNTVFAISITVICNTELSTWNVLSTGVCDLLVSCAPKLAIASLHVINSNTRSFL